MSRILYTLVFMVMLSALPTHAQRYVVDPVLSDSVNCLAAVFKDTAWVYTGDVKRITLRKGETIDSCGMLGEKSLVFKQGKHYYYISLSELKWDSANGGVNPLDVRLQTMHSKLGYFFATQGPSVMIIFLLAMAFIVSIVGVKFDIRVLRQVGLFITPLCILLVAAMEILGFWLLGSDIFWWCDYDTYGFFGSLLRVIPFGLVIAAQIGSIFMYESLLSFDSYTDTKISVKPTVWGMVLALPAVIVVMLIFRYLLHTSSLVTDLTCTATLLLVLLTGIGFSARSNIRELGMVKGIAITLFCIIYSIGSIVAVCGLIYLVFRLIIQVLIAIACVIGVLAFLGGGGRGQIYRDSSGHRYRRID